MSMFGQEISIACLRIEQRIDCPQVISGILATDADLQLVNTISRAKRARTDHPQLLMDSLKIA